jgi:hypothetical protein
MLAQVLSMEIVYCAYFYISISQNNRMITKDTDNSNKKSFGSSFNSRKKHIFENHRIRPFYLLFTVLGQILMIPETIA